MSELKGMKIYMAVDPQEDGAFFIKKSSHDGSLAVFDEEINAVSQVKRNDDNTEFREGFIVRPETKKKIESEIERLTDIATKHATRADELYELMREVYKFGNTIISPALCLAEVDYPMSGQARAANTDWDDIQHRIKLILDKSRIEAEQDDA